MFLYIILNGLLLGREKLPDEIIAILFAFAGMVTVWLIYRQILMKKIIKKMAWGNPAKKITVGLVLGFSLSTAVVILLLSTVARLSFDAVSWRDYVGNIFSFGILTILICSFYLLGDFLQNWKKSLLEAERLKQALTIAEYQSLKNQVNPHFLFNSLNILSALIPEHTEDAVKFVGQLSKLLRYNFQNTDKTCVSLETELHVVNSYLFINQKRFGNNLCVNIDIPQHTLAWQTINQGLLTLAENAIKHNECTGENPLQIKIYIESENYIVVENNWQPKTISYESTGIGLTNIRQRCELLTSLPLIIAKKNDLFTVKLPIIKK